MGLTGPDASSFHQGFIKAVGGTTWHWAASCWRHLPVDFKMQSTYGVGRDWPISYDDIEPYYCRAEEAMGVSGPNDPGKQSPAERSKPYLADMIPWGNGDKVFAEVVNPHGYNLVPILGRAAWSRRGMIGPTPAAATTIASRSVRSARCTTASTPSRRPRSWCAGAG